MTRPLEPLGFTQDGLRAAFKATTVKGEEAVIEIALSDLPDLGLLAAQVAETGLRLAGIENDPPRLPIWKWELGAADEWVVMRLHIQGGGASAYRMSRPSALDLSQGLQEAAGVPVQHTAKPN